MQHERPGSGSEGDRSQTFEEALALIDRYVEGTMPDHGMPGLALAMTDGDGLLATRAYGYADLGTLTPVADETLFQFGSIGKSFTAICLLQLAEEGVIDLHAPVTDYLPWFAVRSDHAPITVHHLLTHTAGIIEGSDFPLDARYEVWALREADAAPPGEYCWYSNVGYKTLGLVLEAVTGMPYARIVQERILEPLRMTQSAGEITHDLRRRLAVGYVPFYDDRPWRPAHGFAPATWLETNTGDGSISGTAADLAAYLRMLLYGGTGPGGPILAPESCALLRAPHAEIAPGVSYGYGLIAFEQEGRRLFGHGGGMVGYVSSMLGDIDAGIGVVVLINGMSSAEPIGEFVLRAIVASRSGDALPERPSIAPQTNLAEFAAIYRGENAELAIDVEHERLVLTAGRRRVPLEPMLSPPIPDAFLADDPDFARFPLCFGRDGTGSVTELAHGGEWYATDAYEGARTFDTPPEWAAYPGHYRSYNPWGSNFRIVNRQGALRLIYPRGTEQILNADGGDGFRIGDDPESPERIAFDTVVEGVSLRARLAGGAEYFRFFTP